VGTTAVRTLESFAMGQRRVESGEKRTTIFIRPGYRFQVIDGMFTNFHMPRTSMLVMLAALVGRDRLMAAYRDALQMDYRFLSFGDSMLIL
jgi:S-adenosylmethionine:tRNA ribosyltransferase-isomerase